MRMTYKNLLLSREGAICADSEDEKKKLIAIRPTSGSTKALETRKKNAEKKKGSAVPRRQQLSKLPDSELKPRICDGFAILIRGIRAIRGFFHYNQNYMIRLEDILDQVEKHHPGDNLDLIRRAYIFSAKEHKGQVRASGEPYLTHPLEVANILAEMKMDAVTVSVGLLHDVVEDTLVPPGRCRRALRAGSGSHRRRRYQDQPDPLHLQGREAGREFPQDASRDDRRHPRHHGEVCRPPAQHADARNTCPRDRREAIARETMDIYAPLANRLGMGKIRGELEDLAFSYLDPKAIRS